MHCPCPCPSLPQQTTVPLDFNAILCLIPAAIAVTTTGARLAFPAVFPAVFCFFFFFFFSPPSSPAASAAPGGASAAPGACAAAAARSTASGSPRNGGTAGGAAAAPGCAGGGAAAAPGCAGCTGAGFTADAANEILSPGLSRTPSSSCSPLLFAPPFPIGN